jgi:long-chain fatty acid transport protein
MAISIIGYGIKAKGMGGAAVAFPQDSLATAANPAGVAFLDNRLDFGLTHFQPDRSASLGGHEFEGNGKEHFLIPEAGYRQALNSDFSFGVAAYGNGGMNTDYNANPGFGTTHAGVDLSQLFLAPTLAYKISEKHALGLSPILAYQNFKAYGLENFGLVDVGRDHSIGGGVRIGYSGKLTDWLTVGATYQSRVFTTPFSKYDHLFAEQGSFDVPQNFAFGVAVKPIPALTFAVDVEEIFYSEIKSVGNELSLANLGNGLGSNNGPGFGWRDVTAVKTGVAYDLNKRWTLRLGYNFSTQPIPQNQTYFNILAPGVVQHHLTSGFTFHINPRWELSAFYAHAFEQTVRGSGNAFGPASNADLSMSQDSVGLSLGWAL